MSAPENETECGHSRGELFANQECEVDRHNIEADPQEATADRPNPTLPFAESRDSATPRERWEQGILRAVDMIFETMDGRS